MGQFNVIFLFYLTILSLIKSIPDHITVSPGWCRDIDGMLHKYPSPVAVAHKANNATSSIHQIISSLLSA